jgi:hypothetical protein
MSAKRKVIVSLQGSSLILSGATSLIVDEIKNTAKDVGVEYKWDDKNRVWVVSGELNALAMFVNALDTAVKNKVELVVEGDVGALREQRQEAVGKAEAKAEVSLYDLARQVGFERHGAILLYGPPMSGKTTFSVLLAKELVEKGVVSDVRYIVTELNTKLGEEPQLSRIIKLLGEDRVIFLGGVDIPGLAKEFGKIAKTVKENTFFVIDSLGSVILSSVARLLEQGMEIQATIPRVKPLISAVTNYIIDIVGRGNHTLLMTSHSQQQIARKWYGVDTAPSFSSRGMYYITTVVELSIADDGITRILRVVATRKPGIKPGTSVSLPPLSL